MDLFHIYGIRKLGSRRSCINSIMVNRRLSFAFILAPTEKFHDSVFHEEGGKMEKRDYS